MYRYFRLSLARRRRTQSRIAGPCHAKPRVHHGNCRGAVVAAARKAWYQGKLEISRGRTRTSCSIWTFLSVVIPIGGFFVPRLRGSSCFSPMLAACPVKPTTLIAATVDVWESVCYCLEIRTAQRATAEGRSWTLQHHKYRKQLDLQDQHICI